MPHSRVTRIVIGAIAAMAIAAASLAQWPDGWNRFGRGRYPPRLRPADHRDDGFSFCRLMYQSAYRGRRGGRWSTDYPFADINFMIRLSEMTSTPRQPRRRRRAESLGHPDHR